ncbi:MAG TPA: hypothetical protein ENN13_00260, partial [Candidatus Altiarchaeales archaeon]|nr:hypothetical protein [Candidatus Altiarchaeales archaeon]
MPKAEHVFECSYEVCNKVGGIYTVLKSKASEMIHHYDGNYTSVGFYNPDKARIDFDEEETPQDFKPVFEQLEKEGVKCYYGVWLVPGRPKTILVDPAGYYNRVNDVKAWMWEKYQVDSLNSDDTFNHPLVWSYCTGIVIERLLETGTLKGRRVVVHVHEWMSGAGALYLKSKKAPCATVFTTHATMLGRTIAGSGGDLYKMVGEGVKGRTVDPDVARKYGVNDKHTMEVACANHCDVFTTVSTITGGEAKYLLGKRPAIFLPNGIDYAKYSELDEAAILRRKYRKDMRKFLTAYFSRYYNIDYMKIRSFFISGRYEFHNKGIDVYVDALGKLNEEMKSNGYENTVIAFIFVPAAVRGENIRILKNAGLLEELYDQVEDALPDIESRIITSLTNGELAEDIYSEDFRRQARKMIVHFKELVGQTPPLCAFQLIDEGNDAIINALKRNGLLNRMEDRVKVIFYPAYLSSSDRLIGLEYNQATLTCDLGVFPSFYEPWGYTPVETAVQSTPAITTDLAGFGQFIQGKGEGIT